MTAKTTTKTTTKTPTFEEQATASREELTHAEAEHVATTAALAEAEDIVTQIEAARLSGDRSQSVEDVVLALTTAHVRVNVCQMDAEAAEARVKRAKRNLINEDVTIATALATAIRALDVFPGYTITPTAEAPRTLPATVEVPTLYVVQTQASTRDLISGRVSGLLSLRLHRPKWGNRLDVDDLPDVLVREQVYVDTHAVMTRGDAGVCEDETQVSVRGVWPLLPVITRPTGDVRFGPILAGLAAEQAGRGFKGDPKGTVYDGLSSTSARGRAVTGQGESRILSASGKNGERRTAVETTMAFRSAVVGGAQITEAVSAHLATLTGTCWEGLGRVVSVDRIAPVADRSNKANAPVRISAQVTFLSATA